MAVVGWLVKTPKSSISTVDQSEIDPLADAPTITALNAPFSGQISKIKVQNGANVTVGTELLTLVDLRQQQLVAWVAAKAIENVMINPPP